MDGHDRPNTCFGSFIRVHGVARAEFQHVGPMLLEHFDRPEHAGKVFVVGEHLHIPIATLRDRFDGARIVAYQLEQLTDAPKPMPSDLVIESVRGADEVWDYDPLNAAVLAARGVRVDRVVPMLHTEALRTVPPPDDPRVDVLFVGWVNDRRHRVLRKIADRLYRHVRFASVWGVAGRDLDQHLANAKIMLNLHAYEPSHRQEQARIAYAVTNGRLVVSEPSLPRESRWFGDDCVVEADEDDLGEAIAHWLERDRWRDFAEEARENFRRQTERWLAANNPPR